jgi:hypothetical protein
MEECIWFKFISHIFFKKRLAKNILTGENIANLKTNKINYNKSEKVHE